LVITTSKATVYYQLENVLRYTYEGTIDAIAKAVLTEVKGRADLV
jgi:hypothetical protein